MGYKRLLNEIRTDMIEGAIEIRPVFPTTNGAVEVIADEDSIVTYRRGWRRVERWEGEVRTHVFRTKISAHKWLAVLDGVWKALQTEKPDTSMYDELAASGNYSDDELAMMRAEWGLG